MDTINGFIEVYLDARGVKGGWEGVVFYVNREKTERIRKFADNAQWFEDHMPYDAKFRKPMVKGIVANAIDVVVETGDSGPVTPIGINLPNDQAIREQHGSKSVSLSNVREASDKGTPGTMRNEFSWTPEEAERSGKYGALAGELLTDMHEVIGHASGRQADGLQGLAAGRDQGVLLGARGRPRRSRRPVLHHRPEARRARHRAGGRAGGDRAHRVRGSTRATPSPSCGGCGAARRSRKTTCATARWWCGG